MINKKKDKSNLKLEKLKKEAADNLAGWQRSKADYINLKKEMDDKIASLEKYTKSNFLSKFLPIYNNLQIAFSHIPDDQQVKDWAVGLKHIIKQINEFFISQGLEPMHVTGKEFDHNIHEAIKTEWHEEMEENIIIKEVAPGFKLNNEVLFHPRVIVNKKDN